MNLFKCLVSIALTAAASGTIIPSDREYNVGVVATFLYTTINVDSQFIYVSGPGFRDVVFYEKSTGLSTTVVLAGTEIVRDLVLDDSYVFAGRNGNNSIFKISKTSKSVVATYGSPYAISLSLAGDLLYAAATLNGEIWNTTTGRLVRQFSAFSAYGYGLVPDGNFVYAASQNGYIRIYDALANYALTGSVMRTTGQLLKILVTSTYVVGTDQNGVYQFRKSNQALLRIYPSCPSCNIQESYGFLYLVSSSSANVEEYFIDSGILRNTYVRTLNNEAVVYFRVYASELSSELYVIYDNGIVRKFSIPPAPSSSTVTSQSTTKAPTSKILSLQQQDPTSTSQQQQDSTQTSRQRQDSTQSVSSIRSSVIVVHQQRQSQYLAKARTVTTTQHQDSPRKQSNLQEKFKSLGTLRAILILGGGLVLIILITFICYLFANQKQKPKRKTETDYSKTFTTTTFSETTYSLSSTKVNTNYGLAVPAFLELKFGVSFRVGTMVGKGGGGAVHIGDAIDIRLQNFGSQVAVKQLNVGQNVKPDALYQEISIMHLLDHPNIVKLLGFTVSPPTIVMKLYKHGDLQNFMLSKSITKTKRMISCFICDIAKGMSIIHQRGIVHCDLKLLNVLVDQIDNRMRCVITDFGIANIISGESLLVSEFAPVNLNGLSKAYAAPELFGKSKRPAIKYSRDLYSFGIIMYELISIKRAYND